MKYLALFIALLLAVPSMAQKKKRDDENVIPTYKEGIAYALPRTGIKVHVKAVREVFEPGPYSTYAEQLLGIGQVKTRPETKWTISEIQIETFAEPDPEHVYKALGDGAFLVNLTENGCLAGINTSGSTKRKATKTNKTFQKPDYDDGFSFDYLTDQASYLPGDSTNNFRPIRISAEQKAAQAAQRILDCRMHQYDMAAVMMDGEHPDGKAYEVSMAELKRIEKNYLTLFAGRTTYKKETYSFDYIPASKISGGQVVFRISDQNGVVPASDLSGEPVMIEFEQSEGLLQNYSKNAASENPTAGAKGVYYRMPGVATVKIIHNMNIIASKRISVAQFGVVAPMPEEMLQGNYGVEIHPETGAIKSVIRK